MGDKNKLTVVIVLVLLAVLLQAAFANADCDLGYQNLLDCWHANNFQLQVINFELADAQRAFDQAKKDVKIASSSWSNLVSILKSMDIEITPRMKFGTVMRRTVRLEKAERLFNQQDLSLKTKYDGEYARLRNYYLGYWQANTQFQICEKKKEIAKIIRSKNNLLFDQGKISESELEKSEITYLEAEQTLLETKLFLVEKQHLLNNYIGAELDTCYEVGIWEEQKSLSYNPVDKYVDKAIKERLEIKLIVDQIAVNGLAIETYDKYFNYSSMNEKQQESYDKLKDNNAVLSLRLTKIKTEIEKQLREMFLDINYEKLRLKTLLNFRNDAYNNYLKIKELYDNGKASKMELLQAEVKLIEAKDEYLRSIYNNNTEVFKFNSLSNTGLNVEVKSENYLLGGGR